MAGLRSSLLVDATRYILRVFSNSWDGVICVCARTYAVELESILQYVLLLLLFRKKMPFLVCQKLSVFVCVFCFVVWNDLYHQTEMLTRMTRMRRSDHTVRSVVTVHQLWGAEGVRALVVYILGIFRTSGRFCILLLRAGCCCLSAFFLVIICCNLAIAVMQERKKKQRLVL